MEKIDYKRRFKLLYSAPAKTPVVVEVPRLNFIMIDGSGDPNGSEPFQRAVEALFSVSYAVKFMIKKGPDPVDYGVMPLEGLWWADDMTDFAAGNKAGWKWSLMIMQPELVTAELIAAAGEQARAKKDLPALDQLRFESLQEGLSAQVMHVGPFAEEGPTVQRLHHYIEENGYTRRGRHREIYLSDLRRAAPERLRTIIRQPIAPA